MKFKKRHAKIIRQIIKRFICSSIRKNIKLLKISVDDLRLISNFNGIYMYFCIKDSKEPIQLYLIS